MDTVALFQDACGKRGIKFFKPAPTISLTPPPTPQKPKHGYKKSLLQNRYPNHPRDPPRSFNLDAPLTSFHLFMALPYPIRRKIWKHAIQAIGARTVLVQPTNTNHPSLAACCFEARPEFLEEYFMYHSTQVGRMSGFSMSINYNKDLLYINRSFVISPKVGGITPLNYTTLLYPKWLAPVKQLALNLKDMRVLLPQIWGESTHGRATLWQILGKHCPDLVLLWIVDDEAADYFVEGELINDNVTQPNRSYRWHVRWFRMLQTLDIAKIRGTIRSDLVMKPMDANKIVPAVL